MWWPSPSDYQDAIQNPRLAFSDPELRDGVVVCDALGMPKPISGSFATVYQVDYQGRRHAVRCFLRHVPDIAQRYAAISAYLERVKLPYTVAFHFLPQGIRLRGQWFPVLKMDWVEGSRLDVFIAQHLNDPSALLDLTRQFLELASALHRANIAHGDLQHGNLLVVNGKLRLLDYDGMYVPALSGRPSNELGQPNYQHPMRTAQDYGPYLDNFSEWVITLSLLGLALDPELRFAFSGGAEALLLKHSDFVHPASSKILTAMQQSHNPTLRYLTMSFMPLLFARALTNVPPLEPNAIASLSAPVPTNGNLPDWLRDRVAPMSTPRPQSAPEIPLPPAPPPPNGADWLLDHIQVTPPPRLNGSFRLEKSLLTVVALIFVLFLGVMLTGPIDPLVGLTALSVLPLTTVLALTVGFSLRYNMPDRRDALHAVDELEQEKMELETQLQEMTEARAQIEQAQQLELVKMMRQQSENAAQEKTALAALDHALDKELAVLAARRKQLDDQEAADMETALTKLQASRLEQELETFRIADAVLPGIISQNIKQRLAAQGFLTAADIVNFQVNVLNSAKRFALINRRGSPIYVEGVSAERGVALMLWRRAMEARAKQRLPTTLPPEISMRLRKKFQDDRVSVQLAEIKKKQETEASRARLTASAQSQQERLSRSMRELPTATQHKVTAAEQELAQVRKALAEKEWALVMARRNLKNYAHINFANYLKSILGL